MPPKDTHEIRDAFIRFVEKVSVGHPRGCWIWVAGTSRGYGSFATTIPERRRHAAHKWFYQHLIGPVPEGLVLDHVCGNKLCVNPAHLDPCTYDENIRRYHRRRRKARGFPD